MNVHPLLVHFPLALLTIYALLELLRWGKLSQALFSIKAFLVIVGTLAAGVTWLSGKLAEHSSFRSSLAHPELIEIHSRLALFSVLTFAVLAVAYLILVLERWNWSITRPLVAPFRGLASGIVNTWLAPIIAIIGLTLLTITGALGGVIVYGPSLDPFTKIIYELFKGFATQR